MKRILTAIILLLSVVAATPRAYAAGEVVVVVRDGDIARQAENSPPTGEWVGYTRSGTPLSSIAAVSGPGTPPRGSGSLQLTTATSSEKAFVFNYNYVGYPLTAINALRYATYRTAGSAQQVAALNIQVDANGLGTTGGFTTLIFEPVYNTSQGSVTTGAWQSWDAFADGDARWWSSNAIPGAPNRDTFVAWSTLLAANPDAVIVGGFGVNQGSGNSGLVTAVDALTIGAADSLVTFDFEADLPPDVTAPVVTVPANITTTATSLAGAVVSFTATATDDVDGALVPSCLPASGTTFAPGKTTVTCSATDAAGNTGSASFTVTVQFLQSGFFQPIDMNGVVNSARRGSVVPVKFRVFAANGVEITSPSVVSSIAYKSSSECVANSSSDEIETLASSNTALRYDGGQFIYNWKTPSTPGCYRLNVTTTDGQALSALFSLR